MSFNGTGSLGTFVFLKKARIPGPDLFCGGPSVCMPDWVSPYMHWFNSWCLMQLTGTFFLVILWSFVGETFLRSSVDKWAQFGRSQIDAQDMTDKLEKLRVETGNAFKRKDYAATVRLATKVCPTDALHQLGAFQGHFTQDFVIGPCSGSRTLEIAEYASGCLVSNVSLRTRSSGPAKGHQGVSLAPSRNSPCSNVESICNAKNRDTCKPLIYFRKWGNPSWPWRVYELLSKKWMSRSHCTRYGLSEKCYGDAFVLTYLHIGNRKEMGWDWRQTSL